jgi:hypothetical protein
MMEKSEKSERALQAESGAEVEVERDHKAATDTTEDKSSTADDIETILLASDLNQEEVSEQEPNINSGVANESTTGDIDRDRESSGIVRGDGAPASSQDGLNESSDKMKEIKGAENEANDTLEVSVAKIDEATASPSIPIISSSKKSRPSFKYDPNKITLRFLFANRDGLAVTIECNPSDTVGDVKGALLSAWPEGK